MIDETEEACTYKRTNVVEVKSVEWFPLPAGQWHTWRWLCSWARHWYEATRFQIFPHLYPGIHHLPASWALERTCRREQQTSGTSPPSPAHTHTHTHTSIYWVRVTGALLSTPQQVYRTLSDRPLTIITIIHMVPESNSLKYAMPKFSNHMINYDITDTHSTI